MGGQGRDTRPTKNQAPASRPLAAGVPYGLGPWEVMDVAAASPLTDAAPATADFELVIGGMTCAACAARVQAKLNKVDGVTATVNLSTERARVTAPAHVPAQHLIAVVEAAGYTAELAVPAAADAGARPTRRHGPAAAPQADPGPGLLRPADRPVHRAVAVSLVPVPGWQWFLVALAAPVAIWAAWPFHQAALRQARHLSSSMDTLVSLGILAACGWSVYAMFVLDRSRTGAERPAVAAARLRRRDLPGGGRLGDHVPAGRAAV